LLSDLPTYRPTEDATRHGGCRVSAGQLGRRAVILAQEVPEVESDGGHEAK